MVGRLPGACGFGRCCRSPRSSDGRCFPSSTPGGRTAGPGTSRWMMRPSVPGWAAEARTSVMAQPLFSFALWRRRAANDCRCGMRLQEPLDGGKEHTAHHAAWAFGIRPPSNLDWWSDLAVVTTQSPIAWRKLAYRVARMPQKETHYDFRSWSHLDEPEATPDNMRAYLLKPKRYGKASLQVRGHFQVSKSPQSQHRRRYAGEQADSRGSCGTPWSRPLRCPGSRTRCQLSHHTVQPSSPSQTAFRIPGIGKL